MNRAVRCPVRGIPKPLYGEARRRSGDSVCFTMASQCQVSPISELRRNSTRRRHRRAVRRRRTGSFSPSFWSTSQKPGRGFGALTTPNPADAEQDRTFQGEPANAQFYDPDQRFCTTVHRSYDDPWNPVHRPVDASLEVRRRRDEWTPGFNAGASASVLASATLPDSYDRLDATKPGDVPE